MTFSIGNSSSLGAVYSSSRLSSESFSIAEKLASGIRINKAADDASGLAISTGLSTFILSANQVTKGLNDGVSYTQVAEGGLGEVTEMLQRSRELAIQAMNGTYTDSQRLAMNEEFSQLKSELDRIANTTEFNGQFPLKDQAGLPTLGQYFSSGEPVLESDDRWQPLFVIPEGAENVSISMNSIEQPILGPGDNDLWLFTMEGAPLIKHGLSTGLDTKLNTEDIGFNWNGDPRPAAPNLTSSGTINYNGMTISGTNEQAPVTPVESFTIDVVTEPLVVVVHGAAQPNDFKYQMEATYTSSGTKASDTNPVVILADANPSGDNSYITIQKTPVTPNALGIYNTSISTVDGASRSLTAIDNALGRVSAYYVEYGVKQGAIESRFSSLTEEINNMSSFRSQILDTDYAKTVLEQVKNQILQNANSSMLKIHNQQPEQVLSLITTVP